jgi:hypothetical protein
MAERGRELAAALVAGMLALVPAQAQDSAPATPVPKGSVPPGARVGNLWKGGRTPSPGTVTPEFENMRRTLDALTPEQRQRFKENLVRWMELSPEEKQSLRKLEESRKERVAQETEHALKESGLNLSPAQREVEQRLHQQMEESRKPMVKEIIRQLREEFTAVASTPPGATPPGATIQTAVP